MSEKKNFFGFILKTLKKLFTVLFMTGLLFGMAFIVGAVFYLFTGNDAVLKFMSDLLRRITDIGGLIG